MKLPHLLSSIATSASAAILASSAYLFAPPSASATTLIRGDDGAVQQIKDLEVNGELFDVEFIFDSYDNIYNGTFDFDTKLLANEAVSEVMVALGDREYTAFLGSGQISDTVIVPWSMNDEGRVIVQRDFRDRVDLDSIAQWDLDPSKTFFRPYAKFTPVPAAAPSPQGVPEPSLIIGFITLGGLMVGSKRKSKG